MWSENGVNHVRLSTLITKCTVPRPHCHHKGHTMRQNNGMSEANQWGKSMRQINGANQWGKSMRDVNGGKQ